MEPRTVIPVDNESANYREWLLRVQERDYAIIEDMGQWTLMVNDEDQGWQDVQGDVSAFLDTHHLVLAASTIPKERTPMETMIGYDFTYDGKYDTKHYLTTEEQVGTFLRTHVAKAFMEGRAAMITDSGDNAIFHVQGGQVLWAGGADTDQFKANLRAFSIKQDALESSIRSGLSTHRERAGLER